MLGERLDDAYNSWLHDALSCCMTTSGNVDYGVERHMTILHDQQPRLVPPPISDPPGRPSTRASSKELLDRGRSYAATASKRGAFSVRRKLNAYNGIRTRKPQIERPMQISGPSDFQHVAMAIPQRRTERFRPLQLSIYMPDNQLSPILPHFREFRDHSVLTYPAQAVMSHSRSVSALSNFSIPRKPLNHSSGRFERGSIRNSVDEHESPSSTTSEWALHPLKPPPRIPESPSTQELMAALEAQLPKAPPAARLRTITETPRLIRTAEQYGRVKSALIERQELDDQLKKLDTIIEQRRSLYLSRSSRVHSLYNVTQEQEPTPGLPSAREVFTPTQFEERPKTAPVNPVVQIPHRATSFTDASAAFHSHPPIAREITHPHNHIPSTIDSCKSSSQHSSRTNTLPPPPPLPLILQTPHPPLRTSLTPRKSFSRSRRVSNWLFPSSSSPNTNPEEKEQHKRTVSNESITNSPKPITSKEGFYQCIDYHSTGQGGAGSRESLSTVLTEGEEEEESYVSRNRREEIFESESENEDEGTRTAGTTTWSPSSSPGRSVALRKEMVHGAVGVGRMKSFESVGEEEEGWGERVGSVIRPNRTSVGVAF